MSKFLETLAQRIIIYDGAMGTNIQSYQLTAQDYGGETTEGCNEYLVLTKPSVIEEIHTGFLEAGSDVIETDSFTGSRLKLDEYGLGTLTHEINFTAAQIARGIADRYSTPEQPRFVAGSIGPTGMLPSSDDPLLGNITYKQLVEIFREQAFALLQGGVDVLLIETSQDILEVRAAITGMRHAMREIGRAVPIQAQVSLDTSGRMLLGTDIAAVMTTLVGLQVDIVGLNCSTGPEHMREPVRFLSENCPLPISTIPNAGIPLNVNGLAVYPMEPEPMAAALRDFVTEFGVNIIGGCCGSSHEHLRAIVKACRHASRRSRQIADNNVLNKNFTSIILPFVSSGIRATALQQDPPPLLVGERVNSQGSRKAKQALLSEDYDTLLGIGREQVEGGAHILDVCVALTERTDEAEQMAKTIKKLSMGIEAPLMINSTEPDVIKAALETYPGRAIINSINMENGRQRIESVIPLATEHNKSHISGRIGGLMSKFLEALAQRIIIYDGAMGTNIQSYQLTAQDYGGESTEGCNEYLVLTKPSVIEEIHTGFLEAGSDVIETDSFTGSRLKLDEYGLGALTHEINFTAAQIARGIADRYSTPEQPRFVAGSIGPTGMLPSSDDPLLGNITYKQLVEIFREQAFALLQGGVDVLLIETSQDILEVRAAITGMRHAMREIGRTVPIQAQVSLDTSGRMLLGTDIAAVMTTLVGLQVDIVGLNCSTGPEHMREPVRFLSENCPLPISTIPNAGMPLNVNGLAVYPMEPEPMAAALRDFITEFGVNIIGGCCGNSHEHLQAIVKACRHAPRRSRPIADNNVLNKNFTSIILPFASSGIRATALQQDPPPLLVGERVNSQGSRKAKQALLSDDYDTLLGIGREQVDGGAHILDVCVALTERIDEAEQMAKTIKKLSMGVEAPLMIDSTEPDVIKAALETYPGRAIINSINMENGRQRIESVIPMATEHGAAVVALTIDEIGMGKTTERKVAIAHDIYDICVNEYGLAPNALIFDTLTFPITTGQEELQTAGIETLEAIKRIKIELPEVFTILGVSNISFGLKPYARSVLNSVFLYHAVKAGLDAAIVNPTHITPYTEIDAEQRQLADDLIYNRPDALPRYIAYFEAHEPQTDASNSKVDPTEGMNTAEHIHWKILHRHKEGYRGINRTGD